MAPDQLATLAEVVRILGVSRRTAQRYMERPDFPAPMERIGGGRIRVWLRSDIAAWGREHLPLPAGRPPKKHT